MEKDIWYYKHIGHGLIDELVFLNVPRHTIYRMLSNRMGLPIKDCHFKKLNSLSQVKKAVYILTKIRNRNHRYMNHATYESNNLLTRNEELELDKMLAMRRKIISKYGKNEDLIRELLSKSL